MHVEGAENKVADCLSHYYENDMAEDVHLQVIYMNADIRLNPKLDELPDFCWEEVKHEVVIQIMELRCNPKPKAQDPYNVADIIFQRKPRTVKPHNWVEEWVAKAENMAEASWPPEMLTNTNDQEPEADSQKMMAEPSRWAASELTL